MRASLALPRAFIYWLSRNSLTLSSTGYDKEHNEIAYTIKEVIR